MLGCIIAAGKGTRAQPLGCPKPLVQIFDTPLIYHQITAMIAAGVKDILIVASPDNRQTFEEYIGNGQRRWGVNITYAEQHNPEGTADAVKVAINNNFFSEEDGRPLLVFFGDNLFLGEQFLQSLSRLDESYEEGHGLNFCMEVEDPTPFGVLKFSSDGKVIGIVEKPTLEEIAENNLSNCVSLGGYVLPASIIPILRSLPKSERGEYELPDALKTLIPNRLQAVKLDPSVQWFDAGNARAILAASNAVERYEEEHENLPPASPEIAAIKRGFLDPRELIVDYRETPSDHKSVYYVAVRQFAEKLLAEQQAAAARKPQSSSEFFRRKTRLQTRAQRQQPSALSKEGVQKLTHRKPPKTKLFSAHSKHPMPTRLQEELRKNGTLPSPAQSK